MTLIEHYRQALVDKHFSEDPAQLAVLAHMQRIADALLHKPARTPPPAIHRVKPVGL